MPELNEELVRRGERCEVMDKEQYWKNRKAGIRGQGLEPSPVVGYHLYPDWEKKKPSKKAIKKNTRRARKWQEQ